MKIVSLNALLVGFTFVWQLAPVGTVIARRHLPPWAPMQVATLNGGRALAVGRAYSRVSSPDPPVWLMPMLTDYGIYPPRPLDIPLPLSRIADETDFEVSGLRFHALFVPGHSFDLAIYTTVLGGKRIAFTGDIGFENQDILHRCWGDADKVRQAVRVIRDQLLPWRPEVVFTGHGVRTNGLEFLTALVRTTEASLREVGLPP